MASVTTKEGDLKNRYNPHGANIHLAVSGCDGRTPLVTGIMWWGSSQGIAQNTFHFRNPLHEPQPVAPQLCSPPQHIGWKGRPLEISLYGGVLHQAVGLGERRQNTHRSFAAVAFEPPDEKSKGVTGPDAGQVAEIVAMRPKRFQGVAMGAFRGWTNLPLVIFRDILLRIHRNWLDQLQLAQRQSGKSQQDQFVVSELFPAGYFFHGPGCFQSIENDAFVSSAALIGCRNDRMRSTASENFAGASDGRIRFRNPAHCDCLE